MEAETFEATLEAWQGIRLPARLVRAIATTGGRYVEVTAPVAAVLAFDDEPAHFVRARDLAPARPTLRS